MKKKDASCLYFCIQWQQSVGCINETVVKDNVTYKSPFRYLYCTCCATYTFTSYKTTIVSTTAVNELPPTANLCIFKKTTPPKTKQNKTSKEKQLL